MKKTPPETKSVGPWTWRPDLLHPKVEQGPEDACWPWRGSVSPSAPIFGAKKSGKPQMTQATRILYMDRTGQDITNYEIRHTCGNRMCVNHRHWELRPNHLIFHNTGELLGTKTTRNKPAVRRVTAQPVVIEQGEIDREWWLK